MRADASVPSPQKVGRNDPCPCGSGKKYKHCCFGKDARAGLLYPAAPASAASQRNRVQALKNEARAYWEAERYQDAAFIFHEIARLEPTDAQAHHHLGLSLVRCGRLLEAVAAFQQALQLKPGFTDALAQFALSLEEAGRTSEALIAFRKLLRMKLDPLDRMYYSAKALALEGRLEEAEKKLRQVIALAPGRPGMRMILANLLLERGLFESAEPELIQSVDLYPAAFERITQARRMKESDRPLIERMQALVERAELGVEPRASVGFGLGKAFSDLGDHAQAMGYYDMANRVKASTSRLHRESLVRRYDEVIARFGKDALELAAKRFGRVRPGGDLPVFIVGMPRSGTTFTEQILASHPAVAAGGELAFWQARVAALPFSRDGLPDAAALEKTADDYLAVLREIGPGALRVTNKQPHNFELLWLIRLALPEARIIHCRRNPVDTCLSIYLNNFWRDLDYAFDRGDLVFQYRQYERLMRHWRSVLPGDRFLELDYEALTADFEGQTRRLVGFLGLEWDDACLTPERNAGRVRTASLWQARQPVYSTSVERWRRYEPWLGELRELLPESAPAGSPA